MSTNTKDIIGLEQRSRRDLRTKEGRRQEILEEVRKGGFSVFWVTENYLRALVATEMIDRGEIETNNTIHGFPWIAAKISKQNTKECQPSD